MSQPETERLRDLAAQARRRRRLWLVGLGTAALLVVIALFLCWLTMIRMPGARFDGELAPLTDAQQQTEARLRQTVEHLATDIGERNLRNYPSLVEAADFLHDEFAALGYEPVRQSYVVAGLDCDNIEVEITGAELPDEIVVVGAHYDSAEGTPGANDNASGAAALLEVARAFADRRTKRTLRFVAFTNEEPPYFQTLDMGSLVYARRCRSRNENLVAVLSLETLGYYRNEPGSQQYPPGVGSFYPSEGNFIGVVGNVGSRRLVRRVVEAFRRHAKFPSEGGAVPGNITGVGWSDHWSFWQEGYSAVMITDTAIFRYPYYHRPEDTPDKLDYDRMARVVEGLQGVAAELAGEL